MRNNMMLSLMIGIGATMLAVLGWILPRRRKTPVQKVMAYGQTAMDWMGTMRYPMRKTGMKMVKGMLR